MNSSNIIKPFERKEFALTPVDAADNKIRALLAQREQNPPPPPPGREAETRIHTTADFWTIEGVFYRGKVHAVDLAKTLLDKGAVKTQDRWIDYTREARTRNDFYLPDFPLLHGIVTRLYEQRSQAGVEAIRAQVQAWTREKWLMTTTRIKYNKKGQDEVIHNYTLPDEERIDTSFVGPDEWIKGSTTPEAVQVLLGTSQSMQEINTVYRWLNGTDTYLCRKNTKLSQPDERVAKLYANSDMVILDLDCYWDPQNSNSGLGVRARNNRSIISILKKKTLLNKIKL